MENFDRIFNPIVLIYLIAFVNYARVIIVSRDSKPNSNIFAATAVLTHLLVLVMCKMCRCSRTKYARTYSAYTSFIVMGVSHIVTAWEVKCFATKGSELQDLMFVMILTFFQSCNSFTFQVFGLGPLLILTQYAIMLGVNHHYGNPNSDLPVAL